MSTNKIQPPPPLARLLNRPELGEFDRFLLLLWQIARNIDTSLIGDIADLAAHEVDTSTHGVTEIVGTVETQTLSNKTVPDLQFDLAGAARAMAEGLLYWDSEAKTLSLKLSGAAVSLQIGQEMHVRAKNDQGSQISNGQAVYLSGGDGANPKVKLGKADAASTTGVIAVATEDVTDGQFGYFTTQGLVRDVNTISWTPGTELYLSAATAGELTSSAPAFPNYVLRIAVVIRQHATEGVILVDTRPLPSVALMTASLGALAAKIGNIGGGNYSEFESDGTYVAKGAATTFRDELGDISRLRVVGVGVANDDVESTIDFSTLANLSDYVYSNYQINHDWLSNSAIYPHIHFFQTNNAAPNFLLEYRWQSNSGAKVTAWTRLICNTLVSTYTAGTLNQIARTASGISAPAGYNVSDVLQLRVLRDNANTSGLFAGADPYTGDAEITSVDIHIETDTLGSRTQYSK